MVILYTITLTVACCVAVALVVVGGRRAAAPDSSWVNPSTLAVFTASTATLSTLAYAMTGPDASNLVPLVIGDTTMPLAVGLLVATLRSAAGLRSYAGAAVAISIAVGGTTLLVSIEAGYVAKLIVLALFSVLATITCVRASFPPQGAWLVGGTTAVYAAYSVVRLVGPVVAGPGSPVMQAIVGIETATVIAAAAVALIAIGVIVIFRRSGTVEVPATVSSEALTDWIGALVSQGSGFTAVAVSVPDLPLHRAAFGRAWGRAITLATTESTIAVMPSGSVIGHANSDVLVAIQFGPTFHLETFRARLDEAYQQRMPRWAPTDPPELCVETLDVEHPSDVRRFARRTRYAARRAAAVQGM